MRRASTSEELKKRIENNFHLVGFNSNLIFTFASALGMRVFEVGKKEHQKRCFEDCLRGFISL